MLERGRGEGGEGLKVVEGRGGIEEKRGVEGEEEEKVVREG